MRMFPLGRDAVAKEAQARDVLAAHADDDIVARKVVSGGNVLHHLPPLFTRRYVHELDVRLAVRRRIYRRVVGVHRPHAREWMMRRAVAVHERTCIYIGMCDGQCGGRCDDRSGTRRRRTSIPNVSFSTLISIDLSVFVTFRHRRRGRSKNWRVGMKNVTSETTHPPRRLGIRAFHVHALSGERDVLT